MTYKQWRMELSKKLGHVWSAIYVFLILCTLAAILIKSCAGDEYEGRNLHRYTGYELASVGCLIYMPAQPHT